MLDKPLDAGGGGGVADPDEADLDPWSDSGSDQDEETTTIDTSNQTLSTTGLGGTVNSGDSDPVEIDDSSDDPSDSSPAGGAGSEEAVERFAGLEDEALDDSSEEEIIDVGQEASDTLSTVNAETDLSPTETSSVPAVEEAIDQTAEPTQPNDAEADEPEESDEPTSTSSGPDPALVVAVLVAVGLVVMQP
ncbi:hypothetical protein BRC71_06350 [Halobacteriales archaeon QH_7_65_31]|nr:MAG: hypothetical protein BRC71_06350 [Halobacteriales archaeon QH_7_65_31]